MLPTPLRTDPEFPGYEFHAVAGTVLSDTVIPRTHGAGPPPGVNPNALRYRELWVRQEDGTEVKLFADADQVQVREGHRLTLVVAERRDGARYVVRAWNHDAPHYGTLVESAIHSIAHDFPGQTGCLLWPVIGLAGARLIAAVAEPSMGRAGGILAASLFFIAVITFWFRRGARDRRRHEARKAALLNHLSAVARSLSLPAEDGGGSAPGEALT